MEYLPLFFRVEGRPCVVAGGGDAAARKAELLMRAGAAVRVVSESPQALLERYADDGCLTLERAPLCEQTFEGCVLAVIALDDADDAARAAGMARRHTVAVNVVDRPQLCTCITPAIVDRSPVLVAITTGGAAPVLGRFLRARLEALLPARFGALAGIARALRPAVARRLPPPARRRFWEEVLQGPIAELVFQGRDDDARAAMHERLESAGADSPGEIYLVAAPAGGDAEDLTLRALRLLQQCDRVLHDPGLPRPLLDLVRRDAERDAVAPAHIGDIADALAGHARTGARAAWLTTDRRGLDAAGPLLDQAAVRWQRVG